MTPALRPSLADLHVVAGLVGRMLLGVGALHLPAIALALLLGEVDDAAAMTVGASLAVVAGTLASRRFRADRSFSWAQGTVTVALSWLVAPLPVGVSLVLSGHAGTYLDGVFDAMSGLTTSGLSVLQDIDHAGAGIQLLRHLLHFAGGQGIVLVVLVVLAAGGPLAGTLLRSEGREERLHPNAIRTARFVYGIAGAWLVAGTTALWFALQVAGLDGWRSLLHGVTLFMAAFDTGGFSIMSTSVAYYHSGLVESVLVVLMIAGALSFPLHLELWRRRVASALDDLDLRTFMVSTAVLTFGVLVGVGAHGTYDGVVPLLRKGAFTALSAATGTGFGVVAPQTYATWGQFAPALVVVAMGLGAMAGSTAGGVKTIRLGLLAKAVLRDVRAALSSDSVVQVASYHARRRRVITDPMVAGAVVLVVLFIAVYVGGALLAVFHGATLEAALFESTSATAAVGLSVGITSPAAPPDLKLAVILQMWAGRIEITAAFVLVGYLWNAARAFADGGWKEPEPSP